MKFDEISKWLEGGKRERERSIKNNDIPFVSRGIGRDEILSEIRRLRFYGVEGNYWNGNIGTRRNRFGIDKTLARTRASFLMARLLCRKSQQANCSAFSRTDAILTNLIRANNVIAKRSFELRKKDFGDTEANVINNVG